MNSNIPTPVFRRAAIAMLISCCLSLSISAQTREEGMRAAKNQQYTKAETIFAGLAKANAMNAPSQIDLADYYLSRGQADKAQPLYEKAALLDPKNANAQVGLGKVKIFNGDVNGARPYFDQALKLTKNKDVNVIASIGSALVNTEKGRDLNYAQQVLGLGMARDPGNAALNEAFGDLYLAQGKGGEAASAYERAGNAYGNNPEPWQKLGVLYYQALNYNASLTALQKGVAADATSASAHKELAELYYRTQQYPKAIEEYKVYLGLIERSVEDNQRYASFLYLNQNCPEAITEIEKVWMRDSSEPILLRLLGYAYYETEDYAKSRMAMDKYFARISPDKIIGKDYEYYGKVLAKTGEAGKGIDYLNKAIAKDSSNFDLYTSLAEAYIDQKDYAASAGVFDRLINRKGKDASAQDYFNAGRMSYYAKNYVKADTMFALVSAKAPTAPLGYLWRAKAAQLRDPQNAKGLAKPHYEKYIEIAAADPEKYKSDLIDAYSYLGAYNYLVVKDNAQSKVYYQKVIALDPANKPAKDALEVLGKK